MHEMNSKHFAEPLRANEFSADGIDWKKIPDSIRVFGVALCACDQGFEEKKNIFFR